MGTSRQKDKLLKTTVDSICPTNTDWSSSPPTPYLNRHTVTEVIFKPLVSMGILSKY